jgi:putative ABC transport system substrate-binding protein
MHDLGHVEGQNISYAYRPAAGGPDSFARLARELVDLKPAVIVTASVPAVRAAQEATSTIPIVAAILNDAVETGVVPSLAHPGANVTGLSYQSAELAAKRLQLLHETLPEMRRIAVFWEPTTPRYYRDATDAASRALGVELQLLEISGPEGFDGAFQAAIAAGAGAMTIAGTLGRLVDAKFVALAARYRLPTMYHDISLVRDDGGLMSYGPKFSDMWPRAATFVDKILKGAKPGDLPVEQPVKFELAVNLRAAKALGLTMPHSIVVRADEVIE